MLTNLFPYLTVLCFHSTRALFELPLDITAATEVLGRVTGQIVEGNDSKLQEFTEIFNYFVNLTQLENEGREEVNRLITSNSTNSTKDDDDDAAWQTAINDALDKENITTGFNKTLIEEVIKYIGIIVSKPDNLKLTYLQSLPTSRKDNVDDEVDLDSEEDEEDATFNPFWDVTVTRRIYNGMRTKIKKYPFVASVHVFNTFACAGAIIKSDLVITAASCLQLAHNNRFFRENPAFLSVRVGSPYMGIGGDTVRVIEVYFHPTYKPRTLLNNLAIMRLHRLLSFRHRKVKKIDFDRSPTALPENTPGITIVGWGSKTVSNKLKFQTRMHTAELDFYDTESCREIYGKKFVTRTNFCAGFISKAEGACNRDVGDPGVSGKYLMGITSFGSPICGKVDTPTVFTKLGYYTDWIEEIMEMEVPVISRSTTTRKPFDFYHPIKLFGGEGEHEPIQLLREGPETEPVQDFNIGEGENPDIMPNEPDIQEIRKHKHKETAQNIEIDPDIEADPEIIYQPDPETLQVQPKTFKETADILVDYLQSDGNSEEGPTMKPVEFTTSIVDYESTPHFDIDMDVETAARTLSPPENDYKMDATAMIDDSTMRPVTAMINADPEETMPHFNTEMDVKTTDNFFTTSMVENQDVWVDNENYTALRKIHHMPPVDSQVEFINQIANETEQIKVSVSANNDANGKSVELGDIRDKIEDIDKNMLDPRSSLENEEEMQQQPKSKFQEEIADEMVKREIQKLLTQLEISSELTPITEDRRLTNNTPLRLANNVAQDGADPNTVLTFLYLTDSEKQTHARALPDTSEEGLSIDPVPFQRSMHMQRNDLAGKSEIYDIFANVMDTVVNKTTG